MPLTQFANIITVKGNILAKTLIVVSSGEAVTLPMIAVNVVRMISMKDISVP